MTDILSRQLLSAQQEIESLTGERDALARQVRDLNIAWEAKHNRIVSELTAQLERARMIGDRAQAAANLWDMSLSEGSAEMRNVLDDFIAWLDQQEKQS